MPISDGRVVKLEAGQGKKRRRIVVVHKWNPGIIPKGVILKPGRMPKVRKDDKVITIVPRSGARPRARCTPTIRRFQAPISIRRSIIPKGR